VDIRVFEADRAEPGELDDYYRLAVASAPDWAAKTSSDRDSVLARARRTESVFGPVTRWAAHVEGTLAGYVQLSLPRDGNVDLAVPRITVHPDFRGRGVGTALLRHVVLECRTRGRSALEAWHIPVGGVGERWALRRGFAPVNASVQQRLALAEVDPAIWQVDAPTGYHAVTWAEHAPQDLLTSFASAKNAIHDAPLGDAGYENPQWTPVRVRAEEARLAGSGVSHWVVAAVSDADHTVARFTELMFRPDLRDTAVVDSTAVVGRHRGHGLGVFVKARMCAWLHGRRGDYAAILTSTSADNEHMIRVNERVGFRTGLTTAVLSAELDAIRLDHRSES
jgi:mycothiol synthase